MLLLEGGKTVTQQALDVACSYCCISDHGADHLALAARQMLLHEVRDLHVCHSDWHIEASCIGEGAIIVHCQVLGPPLSQACCTMLPQLHRGLQLKQGQDAFLEPSDVVIICDHLAT